MLTIRIETTKFSVGYFSEKAHFFSEGPYLLNKRGIRRVDEERGGDGETGTTGTMGTRG
jgi:hypothetical protein